MSPEKPLKRSLEKLVVEAYSYEDDGGVPFSTYLERCIHLFVEVDQNVKVLLLLSQIAANGGEAMTMEYFFSVYHLMPITLTREMDRALVKYIEDNGIGVNVQ